MSEPLALPAFLQRSKSDYLAAVANGTAHNWVVAMGNEAGDLDSIASAIGYSWLASTVHNSPTVALVQTARDDLRLRGENLRAFSLAGLSGSSDELLCLSDIPGSDSPPFPSSKFALVDHNRLGARFEDQNAAATVVAIVDHHDDEGLYTDTADPRIIQVPTGSCSSLVGQLIARAPAAPPPGLATLLLSAILLDTSGLKPGGKAVEADHAGSAFLATHSTLRVAPSLAGDLHDVPAVEELTDDLHERKEDVSHLSTRDLLRRDYKEYEITPHWAPGSTVRVGLASVPIGFAEWFASPRAADGAFWNDTDGWVRERALGALGVLTSFRDPTTINKKGNPKHRREQLWVLPPGADALASRLWEGLKASNELELRQHEFADWGTEAPKDLLADGWETRIHKQKNNDATRKLTAPVVHAIIEGPQEAGK